MMKGGFARKLDAAQVAIYRDDWVKRVAKRRDRVDEIEARGMAHLTAPALAPLTMEPSLACRIGLEEYVDTMPDIRRAAYDAAREGWSASNAEQAEAYSQVIEVMRRMLVALTKFYPEGQFESADELVDSMIENAFRWHLNSARALGYPGSGVGVRSGRRVLADVERFVEQLVKALGALNEKETSRWLERWRAGAPGRRR
jgi:hypothetical protein